MTGLGVLLRQRLRRDLVQLILWVAGTGALAAVAFPGVMSAYGDEQERAALLATVMANPVILLFRGLPSGAGEAQMVVFLLLPWLTLLAALMSSFLAVRHTRTDEETGRMELLSATPASRWTPTIATLVHGLLANVALGVVVSLAFLANGTDAVGTLLVGASCTLVGCVFLAFGLLAAQLMPTSRAANALGVWGILATFLLAGIGNALGTPSDDLTRMESAWPTWLSPFGWAENIRAFDEDAAWPLALLAALMVVVAGMAIALQSRRDVGAAFLPERRGRVGAGPRLASNLALVTRLARGSVIGWAAGGFIVGLVATSLGSVADDIAGDNAAVADVIQAIGGDASDLELGILVVFFTMVGILAACAGVQTVIRARQEEAHGTAEVVLAEPVDRVRWLGDFLVVGLAAAVLTAAASVVGAALGALSTDDAGTLLRDAAVAASGQLLAAAVFVGLTGLVFVLAPRLTMVLGWVLVMLAAVVSLFGPLLGMDPEVAQISPFGGAPVPTVDGVDARGVWWIAMAVAGGLLAALGLMRRRELASGG